MKTVKFLALSWFAVTVLTVGAWAQAYPDQGQGGQGQGAPGQSTSGQGAPDQAAPDQDQTDQELDQTQGPPAQGAPGQGEATKSEGPAPEVARISFIHGDVSRQRGDTAEWSATTINAPLERGDQIGTGEKSRTEIQLDYANILRLSSKSQAKIADLTRTRIQIQVAQGYASYTMLKGGEADVEIDTPNVAVRPLGPGRFRVQVNSDSETDVVVREGEVEISTPQGSTTVKEGQLATIHGTDNPEYRVTNAPENDDWDRWNQDRDHVIREAEGVRKTNRYYTGVNDLDSYGRWVDSPGYGQVWQPAQGPDWAPYQSGRWVWEPYYGWTWVSYEPWGWAPYHYGRWFHTGGYWCWWPGPVHAYYRPVWSPAFVFFVGFGHHSRFGFGSVGWFPIGPFDPYYPWYGGGFNRVTVVSITNFNFGHRDRDRFDRDRHRGGFIAPLGVRGHQPFVSNASLVLTDRHVRGSITSVSVEHFGRGGEGNMRHGVEDRELHESHVTTASLPGPTRESMRTGAALRSGSGSIQPRTVDHFYSRNAGPAGQQSSHDQGVHVGASGRIEGTQTPHSPTGVQPNNGQNIHAVSPRGGGETVSGNPRSDRSNNSDRNNSGERSSWTRFSGPGAGAGASSGNGGHQGQSENLHSSQMDRGAMTDRSGQGGSASTTTHTPEDHGSGWQKFPSNADHASRPSDLPANRSGRIDPGDRSGGSKPPLDLNRPIVTPRQSETHMERRTSSPPSQRMPEVHNESRSTPSYSRGSGGYSRSNSGSGGGSSHSSGGGSHSSGGGSHSSGGGSHSGGDSHSSSSSKSSSGSKH
jgi:hypothetical protein